MVKVYVVMGEFGEYSDRCVWVSGVFATREEAQAIVTQRTAVRRVYEQWNETYMKSLYALRKPGIWQWTDEERAKAAEKAGPKPEYEMFERCELFEVEMGQWQTESPNELPLDNARVPPP